MVLIVLILPSEDGNIQEEVDRRRCCRDWNRRRGDGDFNSHGTTLKKNNVDAILYRASVDVPKINIVLYGECRDMTTTKAQTGTLEDLALS
jgi:hypothetical protein